MKYNSFEEAPIKGQLMVMYNDNSHNYELNKIYDYDLTNIYPARPEEADGMLVKNIIPSYPEGNYINIDQIEFIENNTNHLEKFTKIFKQL